MHSAFFFIFIILLQNLLDVTMCYVIRLFFSYINYVLFYTFIYADTTTQTSFYIKIQYTIDGKK